VISEVNEDDQAGTDILKPLKGQIKNFYKMIPAKLNWTQKIMEEKIIFLEESLNNKKEIILEREIAIEELDKEIKQINEEVEKNKEENLQNAMKLNEVKMDFREIMRKMMAVVSEVSVYQTNVVNMERIKQNKTNQLKSIEKQMSLIYLNKMEENIHDIPSESSGKR
jgi:chromosome segregation ATPase